MKSNGVPATILMDSLHSIRAQFALTPLDSLRSLKTGLSTSSGTVLRLALLAQDKTFDKLRNSPSTRFARSRQVFRLASLAQDRLYHRGTLLG
ncbi:MAG: hypothetical protein J5J00_04545 [Deltaproteobacteria bacterium]|nr:hypothetical protein [Deltaproteobacteria bacterium]